MVLSLYASVPSQLCKLKLDFSLLPIQAAYRSQKAS